MVRVTLYQQFLNNLTPLKMIETFTFHLIITGGLCGDGVGLDSHLLHVDIHMFDGCHDNCGGIRIGGVLVQNTVQGQNAWS